MKPTSLLWLCIAFYALWLIHGIHNNGILHKERATIEKTLVKGQGLIDQLELTVVDANKMVKNVQADYKSNIHKLPKILQSVHLLINALRYAVIILTTLASITCVTYVYKKLSTS